MTKFALLFAVLMSTALVAQTTTPLAEILVVGPLGLSTGQTARLSVLAPGLAAPYATGARCPASIAILDSDGNALKAESVVVNPNQTLWVDVTDVEAGASSRVQLSGKISIPSSGAGGGFCTLVPTLEVFDTATGKTTAIVGNAFTTGGTARSAPTNIR